MKVYYIETPSGENPCERMSIAQAYYTREEAQHHINQHKKLKTRGAVIVERDEKPTMEDIAYFHDRPNADMQLVETLIQEAGFISDLQSKNGICHSDTHKLIVNEAWEAEIIEL